MYMYIYIKFPYIHEIINRITLFDDPEDDIFDGDIGVNDEEIPKALFSFNIIGGQPSTNISPVKG